MQIKNVKVYALQESILRSGYPMQIGEPADLTYDKFGRLINEVTEKDIKRATKLAITPSNSGHGYWLKGVLVQGDLKYTQYWTKHLQRYGWFTYFSGQSQMHKMTMRPVKESCNKYTPLSAIESTQSLIDIYNLKDTVFPFNFDGMSIDNKSKLFHVIMSNCPMGYELWQPFSTNYMSLRNMYGQRRTHKLENWQDFCDWIESLPMSKLIIDKN